MSSYKLIKEYPLSVSAGTLVKEVTGGYMSDDLIFFYKRHIENFPEFWEKIKEPVFKTEDNIEINSYKKLYGVVLTDGLGYKAFQLAEHEYTYNSSINLKDFKWFVNKDKAIEYIDMNKPRFSKKDLLDASVNIQYGGWFIEGLIKRLNK